MNGVQTRFKCKLDVKRCKRFVFPPSSLLPRSNALKTKAIRYFQTDQTLTRIVSSPLQVTLLQPKDVINTPVTLEFLGLNERALVTENDLEQSILDNLQHFLLEMGHGFCFEARQKRILIDEDYFFADLVFYHRILKCHIIVELKIDKFRHEYASQLNMYLNYFKAEVMQPDDNPPIGILLCTEKGDTLVKYATAGLDPNIFVQKYMIELPTEEEIKEFISSSNY